MQLSPDQLVELAQLIKQWTGLSLGPDKAYLIRHRLAPVVRSCGFSGYDELLIRLKAPGTTRMQEAVIEAITTKETSFFRDEWLFDALQASVLPQLLDEMKRSMIARPRVRIWSAATSTGQEAYSFAMILRELLDAMRAPIDVGRLEIVASDISGEAIDAAKAGIFSQHEVERGLSESRRRRYLRKQGDAWLVDESLRRLVQFRTFNLLRPARELGVFDLILCRNVLIYFDEGTRGEVCRNLESVLRPNGWLAVGSAESLYGTSSKLEQVKYGRALVYRKPSA